MYANDYTDFSTDYPTAMVELHITPEERIELHHKVQHEFDVRAIKVDYTHGGEGEVWHFDRGDALFIQDLIDELA